jgi:hypothetical protein
MILDGSSPIFSGMSRATRAVACTNADNRDYYAVESVHDRWRKNIKRSYPITDLARSDKFKVCTGCDSLVSVYARNNGLGFARSFIFRQFSKGTMLHPKLPSQNNNGE